MEVGIATESFEAMCGGLFSHAAYVSEVVREELAEVLEEADIQHSRWQEARMQAYYLHNAGIISSKGLALILNTISCRAEFED